MNEPFWTFAILTSTQIGTSVVVSSILRGSKAGARCQLIYLRCLKVSSTSRRGHIALAIQVQLALRLLAMANLSCLLLCIS